MSILWLRYRLVNWYTQQLGCMLVKKASISLYTQMLWFWNIHKNNLNLKPKIQENIGTMSKNVIYLIELIYFILILVGTLEICSLIQVGLNIFYIFECFISKRDKIIFWWIFTFCGIFLTKLEHFQVFFIQIIKSRISKQISLSATAAELSWATTFANKHCKEIYTFWRFFQFFEIG